MRETRGPRPGEDPVEHYLTVIAEKTGSLIATAGRFGGMFSGCSPTSTSTSLRRFGDVDRHRVPDLATTSSTSPRRRRTRARPRAPTCARACTTLPMLYALPDDRRRADRLRELLAGAITDDAEVDEALELLRAGPGSRRAAGRSPTMRGGPRGARRAARRPRRRRPGVLDHVRRRPHGVTGPPDTDRRGIALGVAAYLLWGVFPAFFHLLGAAAPTEILAHRVLWTLVLMAVILSVVRGWGAAAIAPAAGLGDGHCGGGPDRRQLGPVHLRHGRRPRRGGRPRVLHRPARQRAHRRAGAARAAAPAAVGRRRDRDGGRAGDRGRRPPGAVARARARRQLRHVRPDQEDRPAARDGESDGRGRRAGAPRRRLPRGSCSWPARPR